MKKPLIVLTGLLPWEKQSFPLPLQSSKRRDHSADSMQVYRHVDIGSAKIRPEEMDGHQALSGR